MLKARKKVKRMLNCSHPVLSFNEINQALRESYVEPLKESLFGPSPLLAILENKYRRNEP
jgi:hypothetical protein